MRQLAFRAVIAAVIVAIGGCGRREEPIPTAVLGPGESVTAVNRNGQVTISYVSPQQRKFEWDGHQTTVTMERRGAPYAGRMGIYNPGQSFGLSGNPRMVVQESKINLPDSAALTAFLRESSAVLDWVYSNDGLVVGFAQFPDRQQVNVDLYKITIEGKPLTAIPGARDNSISLRREPR